MDFGRRKSFSFFEEDRKEARPVVAQAPVHHYARGGGGRSPAREGAAESTEAGALADQRDDVGFEEVAREGGCLLRSELLHPGRKQENAGE